MKKKTKKKGKSPTQRTLEYIRKKAPDSVVAVVEHWNPFARIRQDLFGMFDVLEVSSRRTYGIQCTTASNMSARERKIRRNKKLKTILAAGWVVEVWGWKKKDNRWVPNIRRIN